LRTSSLLWRDSLVAWPLSPGRPAGSSTVEVTLDGRVSHQPLDRVLRRDGLAPLEARALVVAVGSNASHRVVHSKLTVARASTVVPFMTCRVWGMGVAYSAHVSRPGYVPVSPVDDPGGVTDLVAAFLDEQQLVAMDATEGNYHRLLVRGTRYPLLLDSGERPDAYYVYSSKPGVLRIGGDLVPPVNQRELHRLLFDDDELASVVPGRSPEERVALLRQRNIQEQVRDLFRRRGWAADAGLVGSESHRTDPVHHFGDGSNRGAVRLGELPNDPAARP
jgi:hypothetical protein